MPPTEPTWSLPRRVAFRVVFVFALLWVTPFPFNEVPRLGAWLDATWARVWDNVVPWVASTTLGLRDVARIPMTGSGDTLFDWATLGVWLSLSSLAAASWSALDRRRYRHDRLDEWLRVALRYRLAVIMLVYGLSKVWKSQFPTPGPTQLLVSFGDTSPEGLLWRFMGVSPAYTIFGGALECAGAVLLLVRRTATLGALMIAVVMTNVVMLNFCYDVPVKLYSALYLGAAIFLAAPDLGRLADVLVLHRPVRARSFPPHFADRRWQAAAGVFKAVLVGGVVYLQLESARTTWFASGDGSLQPAIAGAYDVEEHVVDGEEVPHAGERLGIQRGYLALLAPDGTKTTLRFVLDLEARTLVGEDDTESSRLRYSGGPDRLQLEGTLREHVVTLALRRRHELLLERGFHWVTDKPFYR